MGIPAPQIALKHLRQVVSLYRIWRTKLLDLTSQVAIFHYLLLHPLRPPDNYWSPSGDDVSVSFSFGNGWVDRCNTLKEQLYRSLENVPAAANTNGQTKDRISLCSPDFPGTHRDVSACLSPSAQVLINHPALVGNSTFSDFKS